MHKTFSYSITNNLPSISDLSNSNYHIMLGIGGVLPVQLDATPKLITPKVINVENLIGFVPVINRKLLIRSLTGNIIIDNKKFIESTLDLSTHLSLTASLDHDKLNCQAFRSIGVFYAINFNNGITANKSYYLVNELYGSLLYIHNFKPIFKLSNLNQTIKVVISLNELDKNNGDWYMDDTHFLQNDVFT